MNAVTELLEHAVPPYTGAAGDWDAVLRDAGVARRRRRVARRLAPALAVAVMAAAVVVAWPFSAAPPSTIERALAAAGTGRVLHLVYEMDRPKTIVDLTTGARHEVRARHEVWFDPRKGVRERETFDGVVQWDTSIGAADMHEHMTRVYTSLGTGYRDALRSGSAKVVGEGVVGATPVFWIRIVSEGDRSHDVAISKSTYEPVSLRITGAGETRILSYETLPTGSDPLRSRSAVPDQAAIAEPSGRTTLAAAARELRRPLVWVGRSLRGLRLKAVRRLNLPGGGVSLFYGDPAAHVEITQTRALVDGLTMLVGLRGYTPPAGTLLAEGSNGLLRSHGMFVTVHAPDLDTMIAVAGALRPYDRSR